MVYDIEESGLPISEDVITLIKAGIAKEGSGRKFAAAVKADFTSISRWCQNATQNVISISWREWKKLKNYFIASGMILPDDPRYMLPSELRAALMRSQTCRPQATFINSGNINSNNLVTIPLGADKADRLLTFTEKLVKAFFASSLCDSCLGISVNIIRSTYKNL